MTEEEKKLIDGFFNKGWCCDLDEIYNIVMKMSALIEKLQKENKDREQAHMKLYNEFRQYKDWDSIPKDKIREKIEELEKQLADNAKELNELRRTIMENQPEKKMRIAKLRMDDLANYNMIRLLKQLLEEE